MISKNKQVHKIKKILMWSKKKKPLDHNAKMKVKRNKLFKLGNTKRIQIKYRENREIYCSLILIFSFQIKKKYFTFFN